MRLLAGAVLLLVAACAGPSAPSGPPEIHYGYDQCTHCHMIITEARYSAAARSETGEEARFDDLRGLREHVRVAPGSWRAWVHGEDAWVPAEDAWYVHDPAEITPMGSGLLAFAERDAAARRATEAGGGAPMTWDELLATSETVRPPSSSPDGDQGAHPDDGEGSATTQQELLNERSGEGRRAVGNV